MYYQDDPTRSVPYGSRECTLCGSECFGHSCEQCWPDDARRWQAGGDVDSLRPPYVDDFPDWRALI